MLNEYQGSVPPQVYHRKVECLHLFVCNSTSRFVWFVVVLKRDAHLFTETAQNQFSLTETGDPVVFLFYGVNVIKSNRYLSKSTLHHLKIAEQGFELSRCMPFKHGWRKADKTFRNRLGKFFRIT